jgi:hypothetical protein
MENIQKPISLMIITVDNQCSFLQAFSLIAYMMRHMQPLLHLSCEFGSKTCSGLKAVLRLQVFQIVAI